MENSKNITGVVFDLATLDGKKLGHFTVLKDQYEDLNDSGNYVLSNVRMLTKKQVDNIIKKDQELIVPITTVN